MKAILKNLLIALASLALLQPQAARALGTAFTYQGRLYDAGNPAHGTYDFRFKLFTDSLGNNQVGGTVLSSGLFVTNGLFMATIDFGAGLFNGSNCWLEVDVRTNGAAGYSILNPLQAVTPTPYAVFANTASNLSGTLSAAQISGTVASANVSGAYGNAVTFNNGGNSFTGNGAGLTSLNAGNVSTGTLADARLSGNVAFLNHDQTFAGTNTFLRSGGAGTLVVSAPNTVVPIDTSLFSGLGFQYNPGSGEGAILSSYNDGYAFLSFYTKLAGGQALVQRMVIDKTGNVGIGTANPANLLSLGGQTNRVISVDRNPVAGSAGSALTLQAGGASASATDQAGGDLILAAGIGTGAGGGGNLRLQTAAPGSSGTADNVTTDRFIVVAKPKQMTLAAPGFTALFSIHLTGTQTAGGRVYYTIRATDGGSQIATEQGVIQYLATANSITCNVQSTDKLHLGTVGSGGTPGFYNPGSQPGVSIYDNVTFSSPAPIVVHEVYFSIDNESGAPIRLEP